MVTYEEIIIGHVVGPQGERGPQGEQGPIGETGPVYTLTEEDKQTIIKAVLDSVVAYKGEVILK